jgi:prephenate dehydrogenase
MTAVISTEHDADRDGSDDTSDARESVAICGGGLIGSSLALALAALGHPVRVAEQAADVRRQLIERVGTEGLDALVHVVDDWTGAARDAAIIIAAVPPPAVAGVLEAAASVCAPDALLTDVAGVKADIVTAISAKLGSTSDEVATRAGRFVGGHPMAGNERSGPGAADAGLFVGATWVLTPTERTDDDALARAGALARSLGARVLVLRPDEHDRIVGLVSHLPQFIASVLVDVAAEAVGTDREAVMAVAGPGFRDTTRIAASDPGLWLDIVEGNRTAILLALDIYSERLADVIDAVRHDDAAAVEAVLLRASAARRRLVPKGVADATSDLRIPLRDRPGEIARIAGVLGSAGINIEDLAMRHASAGDRGSLLVRILTSAVGRAVTALEEADVDGAVIEAPAGEQVIR